MNMRAQLPKTLETLLAENEKLVVLLGDIGVFAMRQAFEKFPTRVYNIGILEQSTVSAAAGLALSGLLPVVHTIAPFLVERSVEQLKDDFGYQKLGGNFISVGASYDYASFGCTHHCPGDVGILQNIPGMEIVLPGTAAEFDALFKESYDNGRPTYFRLSASENGESRAVHFGKALAVQTGTRATVIAVGPMLQAALEACRGVDVTLLYYTTVAPFDAETLKNNCPSGKVLLCEPYYEGTLSREVSRALSRRPVSMATVGVPREFLTHYGTAAEHDSASGLSAAAIKTKLESLLQ